MPDPFWLKPIIGEHPIGVIPGDPNAIRRTAQACETWSARLHEAGSAIKKVGTESWEGPAAEAFRAKYDPEPKRWFDASDRTLETARALDSYAYTLEWAQREVREARAEWDRGYELSRVGAVSHPNPGTQVVWQQQVQTERLLSLPPKSAFPGDAGAAVRSHALWRMRNAKGQHDAVADEVAGIVEAASEDLPIHRSFLENIGEFITGALGNVSGLFEALMDPGGTTKAMADQGQLWLTDQRAAAGNALDVDGLDKNPWRWAGSMALGGTVGRAGRYFRPRRAHHPDPMKIYKHEASGRGALLGKTGGDAVTKVRGENLEITPDIRKAATYFSPYRMDHIAERHGPNTSYPDPSTTQFPNSWSDDKIFEAVQTVASDPSLEWTRWKDVPTGDFLNSGGTPARFNVDGFYEGYPIRVSVEPYGEGIITGFIPN